jgi:hypothetical protein
MCARHPSCRSPKHSPVNKRLCIQHPCYSHLSQDRSALDSNLHHPPFVFSRILTRHRPQSIGPGRFTTRQNSRTRGNAQSDSERKASKDETSTAESRFRTSPKHSWCFSSQTRDLAILHDHKSGKTIDLFYSRAFTCIANSRNK